MAYSIPSRHSQYDQRTKTNRKVKLLANYFLRIPLFLFFLFICCAESCYAANPGLFSTRVLQWLKDHPALTVVVNSGPAPISIWTGPLIQNRFPNEQTSPEPMRRPPPRLGPPNANIPPNSQGSFSPPPRDR